MISRFTRFTRIAAITSVLFAGLGQAQAAAPVGYSPVFNLPAASPQMATATSLDNSFTAAAGSGWLSLQVQGLKSLDGDNYYIDILNLSLNGTTLLTGSWGLGGGGADRILSNPSGATVNHNTATQVVSIDLPVSLLAGNNVVSVAYASPSWFEGTARAGFQGLNDEAWSLKSLTVSNVAAVPEPGAAMLLVAGLAVMGLRQRQLTRRSSMLSSRLHG